MPDSKLQDTNSKFAGVCTDIPDSATTSSYKGFMFITLDDGCSRKLTDFSLTHSELVF